MTTPDFHRPVMPDEAIGGLAIVQGGKYVDATFGGGGHAAGILKKLGAGGVLIAFDQDSDAMQNVPKDDRLLFVNHNFRYMKNFLKLYGHVPVDGILADLGVSSHQFDAGERGFSTRYDGPLDMRMNTSAKMTARDVLLTYDNQRLASIFSAYGELRNSRRIAEAIEKSRREKRLKTTADLIAVLGPLSPKGRENKFFARAFQALRIEVNQELEALKELLRQSLEVLKHGGRLVVISYHSLEDRLVKHFMMTGNFEGTREKDFFGNPRQPMRTVGKLQKATGREIAENPRSRSARLRIAEKL